QVFDSGPVPPPRRVPSGAEVTHGGNVRTIVATQPPGVDIGKALAQAEVLVEGTYRTQVQTHSALETHGTVAKWEGDHLTLWSSTQGTFATRDQIAEALHLPKDRVRVLCDFMGGGFGAKFNAGPHTVIAARLARDARAPVKLMLLRHEEHLCTGNRPDSVQWIKLGAKKDGTLVALHLKSYGTPGVGTGAGVGGPARSLYNVKSMRIEESDVFTNTGEAQPFRAPGHPQGCFALEQAMDELAEKLGMDPLALRKKNLANPIQLGEVDKAAQRVGTKWARRGKPRSSPGPKKLGIGVACGLWYKTVNPSTQVQIDIHDDGRVEVKNGAQDIGTGTKTYMAQITAEELGIPLDLVTVHMGDTTLPVGPGSGCSTTTPAIAPPLRSAAHQAREHMLELAARQLKLDSDELTIADGRIQAIRDLARSLSWKQVAAKIAGKLTVLASRAGEYESFQNQTGGVQVAEVEVDVETGVVRVLRVTAIHDCGRPLNTLTAESQVNGGVIQGVSYALYENRQLDRTTGRMVNPNLESYKILGAPDCPEIDGVLVEVSNAGNNAGVAGLGEPTTVPTCAAVAN